MWIHNTHTTPNGELVETSLLESNGYCARLDLYNHPKKTFYIQVNLKQDNHYLFQGSLTTDKRSIAETFRDGQKGILEEIIGGGLD